MYMYICTCTNMGISPFGYLTNHMYKPIVYLNFNIPTFYLLNNFKISTNGTLPEKTNRHGEFDN